VGTYRDTDSRYSNVVGVHSLILVVEKIILFGYRS
jgi:hypothetical protein